MQNNNKKRKKKQQEQKKKKLKEEWKRMDEEKEKKKKIPMVLGSAHYTGTHTSVKMMSAAPLAAAVAPATAMPTLAFFKAGASFTPSPEVRKRI